MKKTILIIELGPDAGSVNQLKTQLKFSHEQNHPYKLVIVCRKGTSLAALQRKYQRVESQVKIIPIENPHNITNWWSKFQHQLKTLSFILKVAKDNQVDLIHGYHYFWSLYSVMIGVILFKPVIIHIRDVHLWSLMSNKIMMKFGPRVSLIAISHHVKQLFVNEWLLAAHKIQVIYDGVNQELYKSKTQKQILKKYQQKNKSIVMMGRLDKSRQVEMFIDAAAIVSIKYPLIKFSHYGYAKNQYEEQYVSSLKKRVESVGLQGKFIFHNYLADQTKVCQVYYKSFLSVVTAADFALSNAMIESMMCGTPVVAFNVGANPEVISSGKDGFLLDQNSPVLLAYKIMIYLADEKLYLKHAEAAPKSVLDKFSYQKNFTELYQIYQDKIK